MSGDASILPEEHEKSLALAAECAKLWPKMLAKGQEDGPPEGGAPAVKCIGSLNRPTSDLWTDAAAVVRTVKEEKESEKREPAERRSEKRKSRRRESQQKEDQSA